MPTIHDLFGYPLNDRSKVVENNRKVCQCPFMGTTCDGGGNRYQTEIKLTTTEPLTQYFNPSIKAVVPGICSIMAGEDIWVVCPRRLLAMRYCGEGLPPVNYRLQEIELTTRLRTHTITNNPHQNIHLVVMHYEVSEDGKRKMAFKTTIDGEAGIDFEGNNTFTDILLPKVAPNKIELLKAILRRKLDAIIHL